MNATGLAQFCQTTARNNAPQFMIDDETQKYLNPLQKRTCHFLGNWRCALSTLRNTVGARRDEHAPPV